MQAFKRTIPEHLMTAGEGFIFGKYLLRPNAKEPFWNPDKLPNPHALIWGESGSGKSRLLKKLIAYLAQRRKTVHVVDLHGDLGIDGLEENYMEFTARNSKFGINPFEFDRDEKNGGPAIQAQEMILMFKKAFMPNMGALQAASLQALVRDTYRMKGIYDEDPLTWGLNIHDKHQWGQMLPTMMDMKTLLDYILESVSTGFGVAFTKIIKKNGVLLNKDRESITESQKILDSLKKKRSPQIIELYTQLAACDNEIEALGDKPDTNTLEGLNFERQDIQKRIDAVLASDKSLASIEEEIVRLETSIKSIQFKIRNSIDNLVVYFEQFIDFTYLGGDTPEYEKIINDGQYSFLDMKFYSQKDTAKVLANLNIYITTLIDSGIFHSELPPIKGGMVNRYDISGLPQQTQVFFCDVLISRLMRGLKLRGEFKDLPVNDTPSYRFNARFPNTKYDTAIVIDEAQIIIPTNSKDKEDNNYGINKVVSEIRKFGGMFIAASQRPKNFPGPFFSNIALKIGLKTKANDESDSIKLLGVKNKEVFDHCKRHGVAMVTNQRDEFESVVLPWADLNGLEPAKPYVGQ